MIPSLLVNGASLTTGDLDANADGTIEGGPTLVMHQVHQGTLSSTVVVDVETDTLKVFGLWQVSNDASTWKTVYQPNFAAYVELATGTAGADAAVTAVLTAPDAVYGWRYARMSLKNTVTTGASADTYSISYNYQRDAVGF